MGGTKVKTLILFGNGLFAAFDENDQQIPELQSKSAIELWSDFAEESGFDVEGCTAKTSLGEPQIITRKGKQAC